MSISLPLPWTSRPFTFCQFSCTVINGWVMRIHLIKLWMPIFTLHQNTSLRNEELKRSENFYSKPWIFIVLPAQQLKHNWRWCASALYSIGWMTLSIGIHVLESWMSCGAHTHIVQMEKADSRLFTHTNLICGTEHKTNTSWLCYVSIYWISSCHNTYTDTHINMENSAVVSVCYFGSTHFFKQNSTFFFFGVCLHCQLDPFNSYSQCFAVLKRIQHRRRNQQAVHLMTGTKHQFPNVLANELLLP